MKFISPRYRIFFFLKIQLDCTVVLDVGVASVSTNRRQSREGIKLSSIQNAVGSLCSTVLNHHFPSSFLLLFSSFSVAVIECLLENLHFLDEV